MQVSSAVIGHSVRAVRVQRRTVYVQSQVRAQEYRSDASSPAERAIQGISTWKGLVRTLWTAAEGDTFTEQRDVYAACLIDAVKRLNRASDERLSVRLGLSLTWLAYRLGVTRELFYALPIDFARIRFRELVVMSSLLAEVSVMDVRLLEAISQGIDEGCLDDLRADEMVVFLKSMAGINWQGSQLQKVSVTAAALRNRAHLDPKASVGLLHILTRAPRGRREDLQAVSTIVADLLPLFTMKELGIAAKAYGRLVSRGETNEQDETWGALAGSSASSPRAMLEKIAAHAALCVDGADPKDLVRLIQAFQAAGLKPEGLLDVLDVWADKRLAAMNASGISLAMAHFARVGEASPRLLKTAVKVAQANVESLTPSDTSKLVWAFAHLQYDPGQILLRKGVRVLEREGVVHLGEMGPGMSDRELANLLWGLVRLEQYPSAEERRNIASALGQRPGKLSGQSAAILLWSFASSQEAVGGSRYNDPAFDQAMHRLGMDLCADVGSVDSQSISMTAWSLGVLKVKHPEFAACLNTWMVGADGRLLAFEPQHVANLVWGLAKSGSRPSPEFMWEVAGALSGRMNLYSPQELFNVCWGYASMGFSSQAVAAETLVELKTRGSEFGGLELSGIAWALSRMLSGAKDPSIAQQCGTILQMLLVKHVQGLEPSQVAMAVAGVSRLSTTVDGRLISELVDAFCASFGDKLPPTISSLNTLLEALALLQDLADDDASEHQPRESTQAAEAVEAALRVGNRLDKCIERAKFWEVCDLCYYMGRNDMPLAQRLLVNLEGTIGAESVTPRGAIMLLKTMHRCDVYPPVTLDKTTSKIAALSPNYRLGDEWVAILRDLLSEDDRIARRISFQHDAWDDRINASQ